MHLSEESVIVLTGASKGIGRATALNLAQYKCHIILVARSEDLLDELALQIKHIGAKPTVLSLDLSKKISSSQIARLVETKFNRLDVLINNAGYGYYAPIEDIEDKALEKIFRVNLLTPLWLIQKLMPMLKKQGFGQIVNISSIIGLRSIPGSSAYCMSKFALNALDESAYLELKPHGINTSLICPGLTKTDFQNSSKNAHLNPGLANTMGASAQSVAKAIEHAIIHDKRRVYLTFAGQILVYLQRLSPSLVDWILLKYYSKKNNAETQKSLSPTHSKSR